MYFSICNEINIRNYNLQGSKSILIRILEPEDKFMASKYKINNIEKYQDVLELYIKDTILGFEMANDVDTFDYEKAMLLNQFILKNDFDEVVIHCSLGISRSPAMMICVAKILNNIQLENIIKENYKFYNLYIVNTFENFNYSIKNIDINGKIKGNILDKKDNLSTDIDIEVILKKMLKY